MAMNAAGDLHTGTSRGQSVGEEGERADDDGEEPIAAGQGHGRASTGTEDQTTLQPVAQAALGETARLEAEAAVQAQAGIAASDATNLIGTLHSEEHDSQMQRPRLSLMSHRKAQKSREYNTNCLGH